MFTHSATPYFSYPTSLGQGGKKKPRVLQESLLPKGPKEKETLLEDGSNVIQTRPPTDNHWQIWQGWETSDSRWLISKIVWGAFLNKRPILKAGGCETRTSHFPGNPGQKSSIDLSPTSRFGRGTYTDYDRVAKSRSLNGGFWPS